MNVGQQNIVSNRIVNVCIKNISEKVGLILFILHGAEKNRCIGDCKHKLEQDRVAAGVDDDY